MLETTMVIRAGVMILIAALVCCSTQAQSLLLDEGESGAFIQAGYIGCSEAGYSGREFDAGFAIASRVDIGAGISHSDVTANSEWGSFTYQSTFVGPFLNIYPFRGGNHSLAAALGLHETLNIKMGSSGADADTFGASMNMLVGINASTGVVFCGRYDGTVVSGAHEIDFAPIIGVNPFVRTAKGTRISVIFEYGINDGPDTFGIGMSLGDGKARAEF
jgi:hypothetical protein